MGWFFKVVQLAEEVRKLVAVSPEQAAGVRQRRMRLVRVPVGRMPPVGKGQRVAEVVFQQSQECLSEPLDLECSEDG